MKKLSSGMRNSDTVAVTCPRTAPSASDGTACRAMPASGNWWRWNPVSVSPFGVNPSNITWARCPIHAPSPTSKRKLRLSSPASLAVRCSVALRNGSGKSFNRRCGANTETLPLRCGERVAPTIPMLISTTPSDAEKTASTFGKNASGSSCPRRCTSTGLSRNRSVTGTDVSARLKGILPVSVNFFRSRELSSTRWTVICSSR